MPRIVKILAVLATFFVLALAIQRGWLDAISNTDTTLNTIQSAGFEGFAIVLMSATLFMAAGGPRQLISAVFGFVFGTSWGFILALLVSALSLSLTYFLAHSLLKPFIQKRFERQVTRLKTWFSLGVTRKAMIIRLLPVGSNLLTNLVAGAANVDFKRFLMGSVLGYIPQTLIFALVGGGIGFSQSEKLVLSAILFAVASFIGIHLYRNQRNLMERDSS
jgi:uncharacterized membrane protein YdjX (TVP38/TMEM64 family)